MVRGRSTAGRSAPGQPRKSFPCRQRGRRAEVRRADQSPKSSMEIRLDATDFRLRGSSGGATRPAAAGLDVRNCLTLPRLQYTTQHANRLT